MTSPAPEAPLVEPTAEPPSPGWRRAAQGLRWMRGATYAWLTGYALLLVVSFSDWGVMLLHLPMSLYLGLYLAPCLALDVGLWRFGSVPASTGAARPARLSFLWLAAMQGLSLLWVLLGLWPGAWSRVPYALLRGFAALWTLAPHVLSAVSLGLLARALGATLRSLGETPPAWLPMLVGAYIAPWILALAIWIGCFVTDSHLLAPISILLWALWLLTMVAITHALASAMGRAAAVLERQSSPVSARR